MISKFKSLNIREKALINKLHNLLYSGNKVIYQLEDNSKEKKLLVFTKLVVEIIKLKQKNIEKKLLVLVIYLKQKIFTLTLLR